MSVRLLAAVVLCSQAVVLPALCQDAGGTAAGAAPGTGLTEGIVSTNSAGADFLSGERARLSGTDPGATGVGGVMPLNILSPAVEGIDPGTGVGAQFRDGGWGGDRTANLMYGVPQPLVPATAAATAPPHLDRRGFRSDAECLNAAARVHATLDDCER